MKIFSKTLELRLLRTICDGEGDIASKVLDSVKEDYFHTKVGRNAIIRINIMLKLHNKIPSWHSLQEDPAISEESRDTIRDYKKKPYKTEKEADDAVEQLKKYFIVKQCMELSREILEKTSRDSVDVDALMKCTQDRVLSITENNESNEDDIFSMDDDIEDVLEGHGVDGIPTTFNVWDERNHVIPNTAMVLIGANTGAGKSMLAQNMMMNLAKYGYKPYFVTLEMSSKEIKSRMLSNLSEIAVNEIQKGKDSTELDYNKINKAWKKWKKEVVNTGGEYFVINPKNRSLFSILERAKRNNPDCIIIDYISLLDDMNGDYEWQKMSEAARYCKRFAMNNNIPVVILCQIDEKGELLYSKRMKHDADIAWFWTVTAERKGIDIVKVRQHKARNLDPFSFHLAFEWETMLVRDLNDEEKGSIIEENDDTPVPADKDAIIEEIADTLSDITSTLEKPVSTRNMAEMIFEEADMGKHGINVENVRKYLRDMQEKHKNYNENTKKWENRRKRK